MLQRYGWVAFALTLLGAPLADAQRPDVTFSTVDEFSSAASSVGNGVGGDVTVTGVVLGGQGPTTYTQYVRSVASCERMLAMSLERPGRYTVKLTGSGTCSIARVP